LQRTEKGRVGVVIGRQAHADHARVELCNEGAQPLQGGGVLIVIAVQKEQPGVVAVGEQVLMEIAQPQDVEVSLH
jgi:hypothetical protein